AWNGHNFSVPSMAGSVVWYRRDFKLPSSDARYSWLLRFESIRYRASIWLNGHRVGGHAGAYIPFEVDLAKGLSRTGVNRLVVGAGKRVTFTASPTVGSPHLWSPLDPFLYPVSISADGVGAHAGWTLESGIRSIDVVKGRLLLNWMPVDFRGGFFHEDSPRTG